MTRRLGISWNVLSATIQKYFQVWKYLALKVHSLALFLMVFAQGFYQKYYQDGVWTENDKCCTLTYIKSSYRFSEEKKKKMTPNLLGVSVEFFENQTFFVPQLIRVVMGNSWQF